MPCIDWLPSQEWMVMTVMPMKLLCVNTQTTGKITHVKNTIIGHTVQWKKWKHNMTMSMTEETIPGHLKMMRRPCLTKL